MAEKLIWVDDLDHESEAEHKVTFTLNGADYRIDLTEEHNQQLLADFDKWIRHAVRLNAPSRDKRGIRDRAIGVIQEPNPRVGVEWWPTPKDANNATRERFTEVRQQVRYWANNNGWELGERGRIPAVAYDAWVKAGQPEVKGAA